MARAPGWLLALLLLGGCVAPQAPAPQVPPPILPPGQATGPAGPTPVGSPSNPDRSCKSDADCTVKNVGNCCGYYPMCVNLNAKTDPEAVRDACSKRGVASVCGFPEISSCSCVQGTCSTHAGAVAR